MINLIKHRNIKKNILFIIVITILCLPLIQHFTSFTTVPPLKGWFVKKHLIPLNLKSWLNQDFQKSAEKYVNEEFGFRPSFVRLNNQLKYNISKEISTNRVLIGKENYLYEKSYINAYLGSDYIGKDSIAKKTRKLKLIQDTLEKLNTNLLVILAPGKGSFFPEFFPENYDSIIASITNFETYRDELTKNKINYIDFKSWFNSIKQTSKYPLFAQYGIHWSKYGQYIAADSLIKYLNKHYQNKIPNLILDTITTSKTPLFSDYDVGQSLNLIYPLKTFEMGYPKFHFENHETEKIKTIVIGDSYYWGMFHDGISSKAFNNGKFWYYYKQVYPDFFKNNLLVEDIDVKRELEKQDLIILLSTDANLYKFAFGFIEDTYTLYYPDPINNNSTQ